MHTQKITLVANHQKLNGSIRRLHGTNLGPFLGLAEGADNIMMEELKALEIPSIRLHDAPLLGGTGMKLVDIPMVFPLFHADADDPRNYYFAQTDDYIRACRECGSQILYRLGISIEHYKHRYFTSPPADFKKWSHICCKIIEHYNHGWADGFENAIAYWEIWNEPELSGKEMWSGTWEEYVQLYITTSKEIKKRFPQVKVGGPALCSLNEDLLDPFLKACAEAEAPVDFLSWHRYTADIQELVAMPHRARAFLDARGFTKTELNLNEWHYFAFDWLKLRNDRDYAAEVYGHGISSADSAAFTSAVLSGWQDGPMEMAHFYTGTCHFWGIFDPYFRPNKCYYALKAFNQITKYAQRLTMPTNPQEGVWVLGGKNQQGDIGVLISCFKTSAMEITVDIVDMNVETKQCCIRVVDETHDLAEITGKITGSRVAFEKSEGSGVFVVEITM